MSDSLGLVLIGTFPLMLLVVMLLIKVVQAAELESRKSILGENKNQEQENVLILIRSKLSELRSVRQKRTSRWGDKLSREWEEDKINFYEEVISHKFRKPRFHTKQQIVALIDVVLDGRPGGQVESLSGIDYEAYCAAELREAGWDVATTKVSGDQGVDLVARKADLSVAIQCKRYTGSVPNAAVQEIAAGAAHYGLPFSVVVSTGKFTLAARTLAASTKTLLISHEQLKDLESMLRRAVISTN